MDLAPRGHRFELPAGVVVGVLAAGLTLGVDHLLDLPLELSSTNARALLAASFGALVTAGAFSFWMLPVAAPLAAAAVPAPAVAKHLHDGFQRRVIAATLGALGYTAVTVLALPSRPDAPAPTVATVVAGILGVAALGGLLVAIQHAVRLTQPTALISEAAQEVMARIRSARTRRDPPAARLADSTHDVDGAEVGVVAPRTGWLAGVDELGLLRDLPERSTVAMEVGVGTFAVLGWTRIATIRGPGLEAADGVAEHLGRHFTIVDQRSAEGDLVSSLTRFTDIAVHAGTGASSAPSTVFESIWYLGAILHELVDHRLQAVERRVEDGRTLEWTPDPGAPVLAGMAVDRLRQVIASEPSMALELVRILADARRHAASQGRDDLVSVLDEQADLTVAQCRHADPLPSDLARVVAMRDEIHHGRGTERAEEYPTEPSEPGASRRR